MTIEVPALLDEHAAAARLTCKPVTLRRWRAAGIGPAFVRVGRLIRYDLRELERWIATQTVGGAGRKAG
jgi:hypothetical protein